MENKKYNLHEIVNRLIGDTQAYGRSEKDAETLLNLKDKISLIDELIEDVFNSQQNTGSYESSVKLIGQTAQKALERWKEEFNDYVNWGGNEN